MQPLRTSRRLTNGPRTVDLVMARRVGDQIEDCRSRGRYEPLDRLDVA